ncbi:MAG: methyltransferase domain-containing protein [Simkania sp.]|nr:methyltransferase domain-containing protein [Simkania sp.]
MLRQDLLDVFCDPHTRQPYIEQNKNLVSKDLGSTYPIINGIPVFLKEGDVTGDNKKYQQFYDKVGFFTGAVFWFFCRLFRLDLISKRQDLLSDLHIGSGDKVLETSIGAGANIPALNQRAQYVGVDISMGMLRACQKYSLLNPYDLQLVQANAEYLPFKDHSFDVVFHFGGINFFNDKARAINEMIRVAKPGAKILIGDETQKHVDSIYKKMPLVKRYYQEAQPVVIPRDLIPANMSNIKVEYKWNNSMYILTFNKPI